MIQRYSRNASRYVTFLVTRLNGFTNRPRITASARDWKFKHSARKAYGIVDAALVDGVLRG